MSGSEKRAALRVPCSYSVRVYGWTRELTATMCDLSRTGMRMEIDAAQLLPGPDVDLSELLRQAELALGSHFQADLHYEMLGPLVRKKVLLVRFGPAAGRVDCIEVACAFDPPLSDDEAVMLGAGLPPVGVTSAAAFRDVPGPMRRGMEGADLGSRPRPRAYEAFLHPRGGTHPLVCHSDGVEDGAALLAMHPVRDLPGVDGDAVEAVRRRLGARPTLEILDGLRMVWQGPVAVEAAEFDARGDELRILVSVGPDVADAG